MTSFRSRLLLATLLATATTAILSAQGTVTGSISVGAGGSLLNGNRAAFQANNLHQKDGFGGIENLTYLNETDDSTLEITARALMGDDAYGITLNWEKTDTAYVDMGYSQFRTYYDADGGFIPADGLWLPVFSDVTAIDRSSMWFEVGIIPENKPHWIFRYQRDTRNGTKGSTHWGDSNLSTLGTRNIVPTFYDLDETRDTITADVISAPGDLNWKAGVRFQDSSMHDLKNTRRRPNESADRYVTTTDDTSSDLFAAHGYVEKLLSEKVRFSVGGIYTKLDSNVDGTRIFGSTGYDPVYDPAYVTRQQRDEGYYNLAGDNQFKQTVANINLVYTPNKNWSIRPSIRMEDLRVDNISEFIETAVGGGATRPMAEDELSGESNKDWQEVSGQIEVRYTGMANWTHNLRAEWLTGQGTLMEQLVEVETGAVDLDRDTDLDREIQKYTYTANWYAKPGLIFSTQAYYRLRINDFTNLRDSTPAGTSNRYPAYIIGQDFETTDFNIRMTWRPTSNVTLVSRYDLQDNSVVTTEAGFLKAKSSDLKSRIFSESITFLPTPRVYLVATANIVKDELSTPAVARILNGTNDYVSGTFTGGYTVSEASDVLFDYTVTDADNYVDSSSLSVPFISGFKQTYASATWVYRASEHLVYTLKYSYATNTDKLVGDFNDYTANTLYAKVQYRF